MSALEMKNCVLAALAVVGSVISESLGGWDAMMRLLVWLMALDYITGWLVAAVWKKSNKSESGTLNSKASFKGIIKKGMILAMVGVGVLLDNALGATYIRSMVVIFFIGNEGLSLLENFGLMGVPYPDSMKQVLEVLREQGNKGEGGSV